MSQLDPNRNPLILPDVEDPRPSCVKCGSLDWTGRRVMGVVYRTCKSCGFVTEGGLPREPADPRLPQPPTNPRERPTVDYVQTRPGTFEELRRRPDVRPDFRKGAPVPGPGEDQ